MVADAQLEGWINAAHYFFFPLKSSYFIFLILSTTTGLTLL